MTIKESQLNDKKAAGCPYHGSFQFTGEHVTPTAKPVERDAEGVWQVRSYAAAKAILRSKSTKQAGFQAETLGEMRLGKDPMLYLEGSDHHTLRKQTARFFTPKAVQAYDGMIGRFVDQLLVELKQAGRVDLSDISMKLAVRVAAEVVGLTNSDMDGMSRRLEVFFEMEPIQTGDGFSLSKVRHAIMAQFHLGKFYFFDVRPAIKARRTERQDDLISYLIDQEYTATQILTECILFGAAGMVTTREFISSSALHLLRNDDMRADYLAADHAGRHEILHEILRLEPVVGNLYRRTTDAISFEADGEQIEIPADALIDMSIYGTNEDAGAFGEHTDIVCPRRDLPRGVQSPGMSFGDGAHRCPGAYIAIEETDIFLMKFLQLEGLRVEQEPSIGRNDVVAGYELRNFMVSVG